MAGSEKIIITAALTGAMTPKDATPYIPLKPEEIAKDVVNCARAGASVVHIHVRDEQGRYTMKTAYFEAAFQAIRDACIREGVDVIVNLTTSNGPGTDDERLAHLEALRPEMCSYDAGTLNWGMAIFENSPVFLQKLGKKTQELDIKPEIEVFDASMIGNAVRLIKEGYLVPPCHFQFVLGVPGGLDGTIDSVNFLLPKLPKGSTWSITGIGRSHIPMLYAGLAAGCDGVRVGLEDNIMLGKGNLVTNAQLVTHAAEAAKLAGRVPATAEEARAILGIRRRSW